MNKKQILILGVILGILALGILLKSRARSSNDAVFSAHGEGVVMTNFDPLKAERILIARGSQTPPVELVKENGAWKVKSLWGAQADPVKIEALIQKLHAIRGELRGSGKKLFSDFGIQEPDALSVKFFGAKGVLLLDLRIGTKQAGADGYFIRESQKEDIFLADLNIAELLGIYEDFDTAIPRSGIWADRRLFNLDPEKVTRITVYRMKGNEKTRVAGLEREIDLKDPLQSSWKFSRKDRTLPPAPEKVLKFIATMNSIRAEKIVDPAGVGAEKPVWQLAVTEGGLPASQGGRETILNAGPQDEKEGRCYVNRAGDPTIFELKASFFDDLNAEDTRFVKDAAPAVGPTKKI